MTAPTDPLSRARKIDWPATGWRYLVAFTAIVAAVAAPEGWPRALAFWWLATVAGRLCIVARVCEREDAMEKINHVVMEMAGSGEWGILLDVGNGLPADGEWYPCESEEHARRVSRDLERGSMVSLLRVMGARVS
jgi:hypothetical protein